MLILVKGLGLGGAERLLVDQAIAGHGGAIEYQVAYVRPDKTHFVPALEAAGVGVTHLGASTTAWVRGLARLLRSWRPQVVHSHSPLVAAVARVLVVLGLGGRRCRHVYTEHNRWSAYRPPTRLANALTMVLDRQGWAVSEEARSSVRPGFLRRRVTTLHHGIDLDAAREAGARDPDPPAPAQPEGTFTFVHVANRRPEKAHDVLLEAFAHAHRIDPDLRLWLVGQHLDHPDLAAAVQRADAGDHLAVLGYRSDAPSLIARADALVLSSHHEGLPVAVMEALALGRPVVSTDVGGMPEAVRHDVEGWLVPPRDPVALGDAMVRLHRETESWRRLAAAAGERAQEFDSRRSQQVQERRYRELAGATSVR